MALGLTLAAALAGGCGCPPAPQQPVRLPDGEDGQPSKTVAPPKDEPSTAGDTDDTDDPGDSGDHGGPDDKGEPGGDGGRPAGWKPESKAEGTSPKSAPPP